MINDPFIDHSVPGAAALYFLAYSIHSSLALHSSRYFWGLDTTAIQIILLSACLGPIAGAPLSSVVLHYIEKRTLSLIAYFTIACSGGRCSRSCLRSS